MFHSNGHTMATRLIPVSPRMCRRIAQMVLIKARLKLRDVQQAHADIERFVGGGHVVDDTSFEPRRPNTIDRHILTRSRFTAGAYFGGLSHLLGT